VRRSRCAARRSLIAVLIAAPLAPPWMGVAKAQLVPQAAPAETGGEPAAAELRQRWQIAPIRWGGDIGFVASVTDSDGQQRRTQFNEVLNVRAASYIWQPWFMQVMGGVGLLLSQSHQAEEASAQGSGVRTGDSSASRGLIGNFDLNVFPVSRFPFRFAVDVTDTRVSGDFVGSDSRSTRIRMQQDYRTPRGDTSYMGRIESSTLSSENFGRDRVLAVEGQMATAWNNQRLQLNTTYTDNSRSSDELGLRALRLNALHSWRPDELFWVESFGSISQEKRRFAIDSASITSDVRQLNTLANWRTDWDEPLIVFGTARLYDATVSGDSGSSNGRAAIVSASGSYRFSQNLSTFGTAAASYTESGGQGEAVTSQSLGAQYQFDPRVWGPANYLANAGLTLGNQTGGESGSRRLTQATGGHQLMVALPMGTVSGWNLGLSQNVAAISDTEAGAMQTLVHSASVSWRYSPPTGLSGFLGLSVGDSRTFGEREGQFQLANFQASVQLRPGPFSRLDANFTAQATRQVTRDEPEQRTTRTMSGAVTYQHVRVFGVPRLRYVAQFNAYNQQYDKRLQGDPNALRENVSWMFEQRLEYLIGRLDSRLTLRVAEVDGKKNASLIASVYRRFGR